MMSGVFQVSNLGPLYSPSLLTTFMHLSEFPTVCHFKSQTWCSWICASWYNYENNQQDALYRLIYCSKLALHVSGNVFAHHQEHLTVFTVSGSVLPSCCRLASRMSFNSFDTQSSAPDDGREHRPKHVELTCNNKLIYIVHIVGYFHSCIKSQISSKNSEVCHWLCMEAVLGYWRKIRCA